MTLALVGLALVVASFALCALLSSLARVVAPRFGLVDNPGGRKAHKASTPLGGGVAIWMTVVAMAGFGKQPRQLPARAFVPAAKPSPSMPGGAWEQGSGTRGGDLGLATVIKGDGPLADDPRSGWAGSSEAGVQVGLCRDHRRFERPEDALHGRLIPRRMYPGGDTVLWIVGLTNSFNFLDNMDGLAGGVGLIAASLFVAAQVEVGGRFVPAVLLVLVVRPVAGSWSQQPAPGSAVFMGDAGATSSGSGGGHLDGGRHVHPTGASRRSRRMGCSPPCW